MNKPTFTQIRQFAAGGVLSLTLIGAAILFWPASNPGTIIPTQTAAAAPITITTPTAAPATAVPAPTEAARIQVYVSGAVQYPGVVSLPADARINEAIRSAGGALAQADLDNINLAEHVTDGEQIRVPVVGAPTPDAPTTAPTTSSPKTASSPPASGKATKTTGPVNINTADAATLDTLPGIGPVTADKIINYRTTHGPFTEPSEIQQVPGIGPKKYDALKDLIVTQ